MTRIDNRQGHAQVWEDRLSYYRRLLRAHSAGFEPARSATSIIDSILKPVPRQAEEHRRTVAIDLSAEPLGQRSIRKTNNQPCNVACDGNSPISVERSASNPPAAIDWTGLSTLEFDIEWLSGNGIGWNVDNFM
jgi:hypothetical protein